MENYAEYVAGLVALYKSAGDVVAKDMPEMVSARGAADKVLLFAPHPDDECISGGLALRLMQEDGYQVVVAPLTLGSAEMRQKERLFELEHACKALGFALDTSFTDAIAHFDKKARMRDRNLWRHYLDTARAVMDVHRPGMVIGPHRKDFNRTHVESGHLIREAMTEYVTHGNRSLSYIETEYWRPLSRPNLLIELSERHVSALVTALSCHRGELQRNPYHLSLPFWMNDNVRRGGELIGGEGSRVPDFMFGLVYACYHACGCGIFRARMQHPWVSLSDSLAETIGGRARKRFRKTSPECSS